MQRIIGITLILLSFTTHGKCFNYDSDVVIVKKDSAISVSLTIEGKENMSGLFFCFKKGEALMCQGDDDSGAFVLDETGITFKSKISLGSSDDAYFLELKDKKKKLLSNCRN